MTRAELDDYLDNGLEEHVKLVVTVLPEHRLEDILEGVRDILKNELNDPDIVIDRVLREMTEIEEDEE